MKLEGALAPLKDLAFDANPVAIVEPLGMEQSASISLDSKKHYTAKVMEG